jgi:DNA-binding response OmpR family regulator
VSAKKILLVDDSSTMLLLERVVLDSSGYQILTVKDGEAGVRAALAHRPDLILLDDSEACRKLRTHEATRAIPVLLVTSRGGEANPENGGNDFISRPIDNNELLAKVKHLLGD